MAETIRILLIETESYDVSYLEGILAHSSRPSMPGIDSYQCTKAHSITEALDLLKQPNTFDVVLLDIAERGASALTRIQSVALHLPVVVLASADDQEQARSAIQQGVQDWVCKKDLSPSLLDRTIYHAIARKQVDRELRRQLYHLEKKQTKTKRETVELRARTKQLDDVNRELDDFIYAASHDLKEPVRGIHAYCELFVEDYEEHIGRAGVKQLHAIMAMCGRLETQISDLLTFYRVGQIRPDATQVDLVEVVDGQVAAFRPLLDRHNGVVRVKGSLPTVQGHPVMLGMLFGNLISNGLKYNRSKRPVIEIGLAADHPCTIYVRDNGIGIAPQHHKEVFHLFRRLHGRKEFEGTGAGLTIVRKIVRAYEGQIWIDSELGRGSTFFFTLSRAAAEPPRPPHWLTIEGAKGPVSGWQSTEYDAFDRP